MRSPEEFDALYVRSREQLLLECFALTGDLTASRSAVRDGFVIVWHHWRKATRTDDPLAWMRQATWDRAHRHHQTHVWQRDPQLPEDVRTVVAALSELTGPQRKALVGTEVAGLSGETLTRLVGLPARQVERAHTEATQAVATLLDVPPHEVPAQLAVLRGVTGEVAWPRETLLRSAGRARRRSHSIIGAVAAASVLVLTGTAVSAGTHDRANLDTGRIQQAPTQAAPVGPALLEDNDLLTVSLAKPVAPGLTWRITNTSDNEAEEPVRAPCMTERFADKWAGLDASVREFAGSAGKQRAALTQFVELSETVGSARRTYQRMSGWFGSCTEPRFQLVQTAQMRGVGANAVQYRFLDWNDPQRTVRVNIARSGRLTMTTVDTLTAVKKPGDAEASATVLARGIDKQCASEVATECALAPTLVPVDPPKVGKPWGMLKEIDLPPVTKAPGTWAGTRAVPTTKAKALAPCATGDFSGATVRGAKARTFVFPEMTDPASTFGLSQTVAAMNAKPAAAFVKTMVDKVATCEDDSRGTAVRVVHNDRSATADLVVWEFTVDVSDSDSLTTIVGVVRNGDRVSELVFVPDSEHTISDTDFVALAQRAQVRLARLPDKG